MKKIFVALVGLAVILSTSSARAQVSWNSDPAAGVLARLAFQTPDIPTPACSPRTVAPPSGQPLKLIGSPVGGADVGFEFYSEPSVQLTLAVRSDMDMPPLPPGSVGVRADVQANEPPGEGNGVNPSSVLAFVFPSLRYDKDAKRVYLGDRLIASDHGVFGGGLRLEKGIRFEYAVVKHREENGFYRGELEVSIVRK